MNLLQLQHCIRYKMTKLPSPSQIHMCRNLNFTSRQKAIFKNEQKIVRSVKIILTLAQHQSKNDKLSCTLHFVSLKFMFTWMQYYWACIEYWQHNNKKPISKFWSSFKGTLSSSTKSVQNTFKIFFCINNICFYTTKLVHFFCKKKDEGEAYWDRY